MLNRDELAGALERIKGLIDTLDDSVVSVFLDMEHVTDVRKSVVAMQSAVLSMPEGVLLIPAPNGDASPVPLPEVSPLFTRGGWMVAVEGSKEKYLVRYGGRHKYNPDGSFNSDRFAKQADPDYSCTCMSYITGNHAGRYCKHIQKLRSAHGTGVAPKHALPVDYGNRD
jgi:hypothetical protein